MPPKTSLTMALLAICILMNAACSLTQQKKQSANTNTDRFYIGLAKPLDRKNEKPVSLSVVSGQSGYLLCFLEDKSHRLMRFFPNRFSKGTRLEKNTALNLPGDMPFTITSSIDTAERVGCFLTPTNIMTQLPDEIKNTDFTALPYDMPTITQFFERITPKDHLYTEITL